jgi:hypothetical protein
MCDLMVLAFQTDSTRATSFMITKEATDRNYPWLGFTDGHHELSHHAGDQEKNRKLREIDRYHISTLAYMVEKMMSIEEAGGTTLLDHSLVLYGSNMGNPNQHLHYDVPHVILGGNYGRMKGGRHLAYPTRTVPTGNLLLSILDQFDIHRDSFGDSTGPLENI